MSFLSISPCHNHEWTPSTAYTTSNIIPRWALSCSQPVFHLLADVVVFNSLLTHNYKLTNIVTQLLSHPSSNRPPPSTPPLLLDHRLQVHPGTRSITALECISESASFWPPSACPNSLDHGLPVHLYAHPILVSIFISKLAWTWPLSATPN
jgi:hypothetical protein